MKAISFSVALLAVAMSGCTIPTEVGESATQSVVKNLSYAKDKYGVCYAMISSVTYGGHESISITAVPCKQVHL